MCLCRSVPYYPATPLLSGSSSSQVVSSLSFILLFRFLRLLVLTKLFLDFSFFFFFACSHRLTAGSGNVLKVQQLLHICSEHFDSKEKEEDKDKKEKKDKDKKEAPADMGAHQVWASRHSEKSMWI